ncbi:MAG: hypothetical protein RRX92_07425 [Lachnospiraceae bacterium]
MEPTDNFYPQVPATKPNTFATAAIILGLLAIVVNAVFPVYLPQIFAALAILFALLSKGSEKTMHNYSKVGITTAIIGSIISLFMILGSFYLLMTNPEVKEQTNQICEQLYGQSFDEITGGYFE